MGCSRPTATSTPLINPQAAPISRIATVQKAVATAAARQRLRRDRIGEVDDAADGEVDAARQHHQRLRERREGERHRVVERRGQLEPAGEAVLGDDEEDAIADDAGGEQADDEHEPDILHEGVGGAAAARAAGRKDGLRRGGADMRSGRSGGEVIAHGGGDDVLRRDARGVQLGGDDAFAHHQNTVAEMREFLRVA